MNALKNKINFSNTQLAIVLSTLIVISIIFRIVVFPSDLPLPQDAEVYFWYANDMSLTNNFPDWEDAYFPNTFWPTFLSIFFTSASSDNFIDYMTIQRSITVGLSVITGISVFFLCRNFVKQEYALIGSALFLFEPRLIQNSLNGLTEPLFLLLAVSSIVLYLNKRISFTYAAFVILALATLTRYEAALLVIPFSLLFIWKNRDSRKIFQLLICLAIFFIIIISIDSFRTSYTDSEKPGILDHIFAAMLVYESRFENECIVEEGDGECVRTSKSDGRKSGIEDSTLLQTLGISIINLTKYFGWVTFPLFFIFLPIGLYKFFQNMSFQKWTIMLCMIFMLLPAFYAFSRDFQELRYLYIQIPLLCIIASISIEFFSVKIKKPKYVIIVFLTGIIFVSGIFYYDQSLVDYQLEREYFEISKKINAMMNVSNEIFPADNYIRSAKIAELEEFPVLRNSFDLFSLKMIPNFEYDSLQELIQYGKENDLKHLVIDEDGDGMTYLYDVFHNEKEYPFLEKIFDSKSEGFQYHVKFFKIDHDAFNKYYGYRP